MGTSTMQNPRETLTNQSSVVLLKERLEALSLCWCSWSGLGVVHGRTGSGYKPMKIGSPHGAKLLQDKTCTP
jgi:hypothetical protein